MTRAPLSVPHTILFVCMGNICRSPTAEGYLRHHLAAAGALDRFTVDSAGTHAYHVGNPPDARATATAASRGIDLTGLRARQVAPGDYARFDLILAADEDNLRILQSRSPGQGARLELMLSTSPRFGEIREVPDPYYGGQDGFEFMCDLLDEATHHLADQLLASTG
ncbi:MAG: low molecular weight protein-tyrosine-phosphatase [Xanthomonadales bacterium]|jgi:protein-tyrosine phosphatase|nr:low molecular weight protein-tyrosine-phosphatase [Xanthomonadales bacterium]